MGRSPEAGFSLFEVLIALAILAAALFALIDNQFQNLAHLTKLRDKTAAHWVAVNLANQLQLNMQGNLQAGSKTGTMKMFNQTWQWKATLKQVDSKIANWLELTVDVSLKQNQVSTDSYITYVISTSKVPTTAL